MKLKKIVIFVIVVFLLYFIPNWLISLYSNGPTSSPKTYDNIQEFQKETNIQVYPFYDLEEYVMNNNKILLSQSKNYISVWPDSNDKNGRAYSIETEKENYQYFYEMRNLPFTDYTESTEKTVLKNGTLYLWVDEKSEKKTFHGTFVKDKCYYNIVFENNNLDDSIGKDKLIDYVKLVENIQ